MPTNRFGNVRWKLSVVSLSQCLMLGLIKKQYFEMGVTDILKRFSLPSSYVRSYVAKQLK